MKGAINDSMGVMIKQNKNLQSTTFAFFSTNTDDAKGLQP